MATEFKMPDLLLERYEVILHSQKNVPGVGGGMAKTGKKLSQPDIRVLDCSKIRKNTFSVLFRNRENLLQSTAEWSSISTICRPVKNISTRHLKMLVDDMRRNSSITQALIDNMQDMQTLDP